MKKRGLSLNKRGQDLSIGTLILIVLGIVVLVVLILGFSLGWSNLFSKIGITTGSDLSAMVAACKVAAASESQASFCECRNVKLTNPADGKSDTYNINCGYTIIDRELGTEANKYTCVLCDSRDSDFPSKSTSG